MLDSSFLYERLVNKTFYKPLAIHEPPALSRYSYSFVDSIEEIGVDAWNACAGIKSPFTRYEFLHALEATGCTTAAAGWQPHHAAVRLAETGGTCRRGAGLS